MFGAASQYIVSNRQGIGLGTKMKQWIVWILCISLVWMGVGGRIAAVGAELEAAGLWQEAQAAGSEETEAAPELLAQAAVLMDGESGRVLYGKNADRVLPMASTTKIMTCILALEHAAPDAVVTVSTYAASMPDVQLNIRKGETYYMRDLLHSLMLESHNDTAVAIAEHIGGSVEGFADMMNQKARDLGCAETCFVTPNGLDGTDAGTGNPHATTAADLARIMRYCIRQSPKREEFLAITRAPSHTFSDVGRTRSFSCVNHNALLTSMDGALSGKTGFTNKAGYCYVGAVERGEKTFIAVLLACGWPPHKTYKWQDMRKLIAYADRAYDYYEIWGDGDQPGERIEPGEIPVVSGIAPSVTLRACYPEAGADGRPFRVLMRKEEPVTVRTTTVESLTAPVEAGTPVGQAEYRIGGDLVATIPIVTAERVGRWDAEFCLKTLLKRFLICYNARETNGSENGSWTQEERETCRQH